MVRTSFLRLVTALFLRAQNIFSLYTRREKGSHREVCTKLLRPSLNKATAQLGLNYSSVGIVVRLWAVQRYRSFPEVNPPKHKADRSLLCNEWLRMSGAMPPFSYMPSRLTQEQLYLAVKLSLKSLAIKIKWKKFTVTGLKFLNSSNDKTSVSRTGKYS
jgi:hypothetical protein